MRFVTATAFVRNFAEIQHDVHRETLTVTSHNRVTGYFVRPKTSLSLKTCEKRPESLSSSAIFAAQPSNRSRKHAWITATRR